MIFEAKTIPLRDGRTCTLRPVHPDDSADLIEYMVRTADETEFVLRYPDEIHYTEEQERELLGNILQDPGTVMMVGIVDGKLAGNCSLSGIGMKRKIRHRSSLAIALYREYWGLGIGKAMIDYLTELAGEIGYEQIDLEVVEDNTRAQSLYRKCGFMESGRRTRALKFDDGTYHDEILMTKILKGT